MTNAKRTEVPAMRVPTTSRRRASVSVRVADGAVTVAVTGNLDAGSVAAFRAELLQLCQVCVGDLIVDLSTCTGITVAVMDAVDSAREACLRGRCRLRVFAARAEIASPRRPWSNGIPLSRTGPRARNS